MYINQVPFYWIEGGGQFLILVMGGTVFNFLRQIAMVEFITDNTDYVAIKNAIKTTSKFIES